MPESQESPDLSSRFSGQAICEFNTPDDVSHLPRIFSTRRKMFRDFRKIFRGLVHLFGDFRKMFRRRLGACPFFL